MEDFGEVSPSYFLNIEYSHPTMEYTIPIELNKMKIMVYSEILSPLFIRRYLEYQHWAFQFDMDYTVDIIDVNLNHFQLKSNQSILLGREVYLVKDTTNRSL